MSAYTHGPWHLVIERFPGRPDEITGVCGDEGQTISNDIPHEWDARLIAAAPELYEALEALVNAGYWADHPDATDAALKVLKKARGEL